VTLQFKLRPKLRTWLPAPRAGHWPHRADGQTLLLDLNKLASSSALVSIASRSATRPGHWWPAPRSLRNQASRCCTALALATTDCGSIFASPIGRASRQSASEPFSSHSASNAAAPPSDCSIHERRVAFTAAPGKPGCARRARRLPSDPADVLGHECAVAAHLAEHLAALHGVRPDGRFLDKRRGGLEP